MQRRSLDPDLEPVFAMLVTDPQFSETANEFLTPLSYGERHRVSSTGPNFFDDPADCPACAPHRVVFIATGNAAKIPPVATITTIIPGKREIARNHGPKPKNRRTT